MYSKRKLLSSGARAGVAGAVLGAAGLAAVAYAMSGKTEKESEKNPSDLTESLFLSDTCAVCLENLEGKPCVKHVFCKKVFHARCIAHMLLLASVTPNEKFAAEGGQEGTFVSKDPMCPTCRKPINPGGVIWVNTPLAGQDVVFPEFTGEESRAMLNYTGKIIHRTVEKQGQLDALKLNNSDLDNQQRLEKEIAELENLKTSIEKRVQELIDSKLDEWENLPDGGGLRGGGCGGGRIYLGRAPVSSGRKYVAVVGGRRVYFGERGASDFTKHQDAGLRRKYLRLHRSLGEDWTRGGVASEGFWARWLLWNKPSKRESIRYLEHKLDVKIRPLLR